MQKQLLVFDSQFRTNIEKTDGDEYEYKFKLNKSIQINGPVHLEQFIFQNSQYVFNSEKKSNKFIYTDNNGIETIITIEGKYETIDDFVKQFNKLTQALNIKMIYTSYLYEIKIPHLNGSAFSLSEFYDLDGTFMKLIGFNKVNHGQNVYSNMNTPKLFSQSLISVSIPEFGTYNTITQGSKPYTFLVLSQQGFEIVANINTTFSNTFYVSNKNLDELTTKIRDSDGLPFVNNKGNANAILVLNY